MSKKSAAGPRAERAAAALAEQRRKERRRTTLAVLGVVVAMVVIVAGGFLLSQRDSGPTDAAGDPGTGKAASVSIGPADAPHQVVIWEDFLCPFCRELESHTRDQLTSAAEDGRVRVTYRPFTLLSRVGPYSQESLEVFAATQQTAGDEVAKKLHDLLYEHQPSETGPFPSQDDLVDLAVQAGADRAKVQGALDSGEAKAAADASTQAAEEAGVQSTPTVFLDGDEVTGRTLGDLVSNLLAGIS